MRVERLPDPPARAPDLSAVIVNYRSWPDVVRLVDALAGSPGVRAGRCEVVVVDNDSGEPIPRAILDPPPGIRLVVERTNGGFSSGVNAGWRVSGGGWLLVLNPDVVPPPEFVGRVLDRIDRWESDRSAAPGVVGFELRNPDGSKQPSVGAYPSLARVVVEQFLPRGRRKYQPDRRHRAGRVDWVTGACLLLSTRMMADVGGMDDDFFLYHEEVALCRVATRRGWGVEFDPSIAVEHLRPLQNRPISPKMRAILRHSKLLYFRKHLPRWQFGLLRAAVRLEAKVLQAWHRRKGNGIQARSWELVGRVADRVGRADPILGVQVARLAESLEEPSTPAEPPTPARQRPARSLMR